MTSKIRKEVMAILIKEADEITQSGQDSWGELERRYPGIPSDVIASAWLAAEDAATERWWESIEKTIDGDLIKNALAKPI